LAFSEEYFIKVQGEQKGPYTYPQLKALYEKGLVPEETEYWRDGMEQWEAVAELCGATRRERMRRLNQIRLLGIVTLTTLGLLLVYCEPVLRDGWREMNARDFTQEGAYWRARGFVRDEVRRTDGSVAFESYPAATVGLTGTEATVVLPGTLYGRSPAGVKTTWKVVVDYDTGGREWVLGGGKL